MTKKPVQFRFSYATLTRLDWLCRRLDLNRSQVVRLAVGVTTDRRKRTDVIQLSHNRRRWDNEQGNTSRGGETN